MTDPPNYAADHLRMLAEHGELWVTALHEAGHAVFCGAYGIPIYGLSARPDGTSAGHIRYRFSDPKPDECTLTSSWATMAIRVTLSGDRVVRLYDPFKATAGGARTSDFHHVSVLLEALSNSEADVASELRRHLDAVDAFFARPEIRLAAHRLALALVEADELTAEQVYELLSSGQCGAYSPDFSMRCTDRPPEHVGANHGVRPSPDGAVVRWSLYEFSPGFFNSRQPKTAQWRRVMTAWDPSRFPRRKPVRSILDLEELDRRSKDPTLPKRSQDAASSQLMELVARRLSATFMADLPPRRDAPAVSRFELHEAECGHGTVDGDGVWWCRVCAYEEPAAPAATWAYVVQKSRLSAGGEWFTSGSIEVFDTAEAAASYLKGVRMSRERDVAWDVQRARLRSDRGAEK